MKKRSHLFVNREIIEQVPENKRKWLLLGSILPDILVHTYIKKHTWKSSFDNTVNRIQKLEEKGKNSRYSFLKLGYVLHYVEDFFTYAHNSIFEGGFSEHVAYESGFQKFLFGHGHVEQEETSRIGEMVHSVEEAVEYLKKNHALYMTEAGDNETDARYIRNASKTIGTFLVRAFAMNSVAAEEYVPTYALAPSYRK